MCIFADDSTFTLSNIDPVELTEGIKVKYKMIADYMAKNKLVLNSDKTHLLVMTSSRSHHVHQNFGITLDSGAEIIEPGHEERLLGGIITNDMKWNGHVRDSDKSLSKILTSRINALSKVSAYSSFKTRKMIANGVVLSHLTYLVQLYGGCNEQLILSLQILQNKAARLVTQLDGYTPIATLLLQFGWQSLRKMVAYHSLNLLHKSK